MISVMDKYFFVADWINGAKVIKAKTLKEAVQKYSGRDVILTLHHDLSSIFGCESSEIIKNIVLSNSDGVEQTNALFNLPETKCYVFLNE
jgi:hypothetical protein